MIELRHYQAGCTPAVVNYLIRNKGKCNPLVALPTGAGKTYCIADLIREISTKWGRPVVVLSHVREILEQNHAALSEYLKVPVGLNSAGLGKREFKQITVAGIQSVYKQPERFGDRFFAIVDEAHLISPDEDTMYQRFFRGASKCIITGFTATPFRLGHGYIYGDDCLFDDLVYDWTSRERFQQLVDEGYLATLTTKRTKLEMDTSDVKITAGDFNEKALSDKFDREAVTQEAIKEILEAGRNRKKWLIFAIDISHAQHIAETLIRSGIKCAPVHSQMGADGFDRNKTVEGFKDGRYRAVVNVNILTTGFDDPGIDLIAMLRPTKSPVLHVQSLGRGSRVQEGKDNCLVLDFAGNISRLGPINDVIVTKKGKGKEGGDPIMKSCPVCMEYVYPAVRICPCCNHEFQFEHHLSSTAATLEIIESGGPQWLEVDSVKYDIQRKFAAPSMIKVSYQAEGITITEMICIEHNGFAKHKADHWVDYRGGERCNTVDDFMNQAHNLAQPKEILVQKKGKYKVIKDARFNF